MRKNVVRNSKETRTSKSEAVLSIVRIIFALAAIALASYLVFKLTTYFIQNKENSSIQDMYEISETMMPTLGSDVLAILAEKDGFLEETDSAESTESAISFNQAIDIYMKQPLKSYDYEGLKGANNDFTAWLDIPNTSISYPVVQSHDNTDYLKKSFEGVRRSSGAIFIDANIKNYKTTQHLVVHGHNMKSGSMFALLPSYQNISYYNHHPFIYLYTPDEVMVYQVISAYSIPHDMKEEQVYQTSFSSDEEYKQFVDRFMGRSIISTNVEISYEKTILTLSTCINNNSSRFVVHAIRFQ